MVGHVSVIILIAYLIIILIAIMRVAKINIRSLKGAKAKIILMTGRLILRDRRILMIHSFTMVMVMK